MSGGFKLTVCGLLTCYTSIAHAFQDLPAATPMLNEPYFEKQAQQVEDNVSISESEFKQSYNRAKRPTVMILFGRQLNDVVSDWAASTKLNISTEVKNSSQSNLPHAASTDISLQTKSYNGKRRSEMLTTAQWDELERGFRQAALSYGVKLLNQNLAIRLLDAELRESATKAATVDQQRMELDVLKKHSSLLIEIIPYLEDDLSKEEVGFNISFSSLQDASIVAERRIGLATAPLIWKAGSNGYELVRENSATPRYIAGPNGYNVIQAEPKFWYDQGQKLGKAFIEMFYSEWLIAQGSN